MNPTFTLVLCGVALGLPTAGFLINALSAGRLPHRVVTLLGPGVVLGAFAASVILLVELLTQPPSGRGITVILWHWLNLSVGPANGALGRAGFNANFSLRIDPLSILMMLVITGIGGLIHVYSVGYMAEDPSYNRFFAYMNLFITSMLVLVMSENLIFLIVGWSMVAFASYALIAFWYQRPAAVAAGRKAFITQVIGDVGLVLGAFLIFLNLRGSGGQLLRSVDLQTIFANVGPGPHFHNGLGPSGGGLVTAIGLLLFLGAAAKSAQWPLHTWLPDAMEGPTPVSALIHAATMVTAGVYLVARFHPIFQQAPVAAGVVAAVGIGTALMAAIIGCTQFDIKRVIAYSTMSQIGLMIFAVGAGAYAAGMFQFFTHACFKALLFLAAGNVIHALHDEQDIRSMGGLSTRMKLTFGAFLVGSLALAGIPLFAGWFSKEELLSSGLVLGPAVPWLWLLGVSVNVLTSFYIFRVVWAVFRGEPTSERAAGAHEAGPTMLAPVLVLAVLSAVVGFLNIDFFGFHPITLFSTFLDPVVGGSPAQSSPGIQAVALLAGTLLSLGGVALAWAVYGRRLVSAQLISRHLPWLYQLSLNGFYWDELYGTVLVRPTGAAAAMVRVVFEGELFESLVGGVRAGVRTLADDLRTMQTGYFRDYALLFFVCAVIGLVVLGLRLA
ncbi:MAG TPA: NADH-quinone oxidoreductase subunit L [Candidatus Dormibacteraeota bacterium]|nr:NADH-quinone oxidoreductase subunit L [Candidatus Dormibacteraeota bacterium]